jgi:TolB-like protein
MTLTLRDGVQDEILNNLAKIAQLKVISRTSVMKYRAGTDRDLRQIASALGAANVLEGTVRRDGNHVRVSTELIDARNDHTIWADSHSYPLGNRSDIVIEHQTLQGLRTTVNLSQMDAAPLGLQMFLVFGSSGRERQKLGVLAKAR